MCTRPKAPKIVVPESKKTQANVLYNPFLDAISKATEALTRGRLGVNQLKVNPGQSSQGLAGLSRNPLTTFGVTSVGGVPNTSNPGTSTGGGVRTEPATGGGYGGGYSVSGGGGTNVDPEIRRRLN